MDNLGACVGRPNLRRELFALYAGDAFSVPDPNRRAAFPEDETGRGRAKLRGWEQSSIRFLFHLSQFVHRGAKVTCA